MMADRVVKVEMDRGAPRCFKCPFGTYTEIGQFSMMVCTLAPTADTLDVGYAAPDWCPLRTGRVIVRVDD